MSILGVPKLEYQSPKWPEYVTDEAISISDDAHPIIITVIFSFPKFVSICKKLAHFSYSFLRYSRF